MPLLLAILRLLSIHRLTLILFITSGSFLAIFYVIFPLLFFIGALFEKTNIPSFDPADADAKIPDHPELKEALQAGFRPLGHFTNGRKGSGRELYSIALSPDLATLLLILHGKILKRVYLITHPTAGPWIITSDFTSKPELSGVVEELMLPSTDFPTRLEYHLERISKLTSPPIPFSPDTAPADLQEHYRDRVEKLISLSLARYRSADQSAWTYTLAGATRYGLSHYSNLSKIRQQARIAVSRKEFRKFGVRPLPPI